MGGYGEGSSRGGPGGGGLGGGGLALGLLLLISSACVGRAAVAPFAGVRSADGAGVATMNDARTYVGESAFPSLLVENRSGYQVAIRLNGVRLATATTGFTCVRIPKTVGEIQLEFAPLGIAAQLAPTVYLEESPHWRVELLPGVTIKYDVLSLAPSGRGCRM